MRRGFSLIEVLLAAAVIATVLMGIGLFQMASVKANQNARDRAFAVQKAVQIMEEIQAFQVTASNNGSGSMDALSDGANGYRFMLTIDPKVQDPANALSGNILNPTGSGYRFVRQIIVQPMPSESDARQVTVSVFYSDGGANAAPKPGMPALATVTNVVKAKKIVSVPTQVYDMFFINIENTIGWWCDKGTLEQTMLGTVDFLEQSNPGLVIRQHWIRQLGYGRDPYYTPTINKAFALTDLTNTPLNWVYFYPGNRDGNTFNYDPDVMHGQMLQDGTLANSVVHGPNMSDYYANQSAYAYADQYNYDMRYPDEAAKFAQMPSGSEPTLRLFLEDLAAGRYKNAIIVNLHGEGMPFVPMCNYAFAARPPQDTTDGAAFYKNQWGVSNSTSAQITDSSRCRLVTHPEDLEVQPNDNNDSGFTGNDTVRLNVFPYLDANHGTEPANSNFRNAEIVVRGLQSNLTPMYGWWSGPGDVEIDVLDAGAPADSNGSQSSAGGAVHGGGGNWKMIWPKLIGWHKTLVPSTFTGLYYDDNANKYYLAQSPSFVGGHGGPGPDLNPGDLVIHLKNLNFTNGLPLLHGLNYFPDPALPDLSTTPAAGTPKNSARFRILFRCPNRQLLTVVTTLGDDTDLSHHHFPNRSTTYCWVGQTPPFSEQYQFMGDPRENPYRDVRNAQRYNRFFATLDTDNAYVTGNSAGWNNFPDTHAAWAGTAAEDMPRYYELLRRALFGSNSLLVNVTGWSFYYHVFGGEIESSVSSKPYDGGNSLFYDENMLNNGSNIAHQRLITKSDGSWYSKPWLGEIYPDSEWSDWATKGNIPSGTYLRRPYNDALIPSWVPGGSNFNVQGVVGAQGCAGFYNGGSSGSGRSNEFDHIGATGNTGQISTNGSFVASSMKLSLDTNPAIDRPFRLDATDNQPTDWSDPETVGWGTLLEWGLHNNGGGYYWDPDQTAPPNDAVLAGAPVVIRRKDSHGNWLAAYTEVNGLAPSVTGGTLPIARNALSCGLEALLDLAYPKYQDGSDKGDQAPKLPPHLQLTQPSDSSQITGSSVVLKWHLDWQRWDTSPYSNQFPDSTVGDYVLDSYKPTIVFNLLWSSDGVTWHNLDDNSLAQEGVYDSNHDPGIKVDSSTSWDGTYTWTLPGMKTMPNGAYQVRVEGFRKGNGYTDCIYAYHQITLSFAR